jgi:hypothetical protein
VSFISFCLALNSSNLGSLNIYSALRIENCVTQTYEEERVQLFYARLNFLGWDRNAKKIKKVYELKCSTYHFYLPQCSPNFYSTFLPFHLKYWHTLKKFTSNCIVTECLKAGFVDSFPKRHFLGNRQRRFHCND